MCAARGGILARARETDGGQGRNRTGVRGFAGRCMTTLPPGHPYLIVLQIVFCAASTHPASAERDEFLEKVRKKNKTPVSRGFAVKSGAGNETRTRDPDLGKVVLYQLSYFR